MKNQTDMIVIIVAGVFTAGAGLGMWFMKREPIVPAVPTTVPTTAAPLPSGDVVFANTLPSGGGSQAGFGGMGGPGAMGMGMAMGMGKKGMMPSGPGPGAGPAASGSHGPNIANRPGLGSG